MLLRKTDSGYVYFSAALKKGESIRRNSSAAINVQRDSINQETYPKLNVKSKYENRENVEED